MDIDKRLQEAVQSFWTGRDAQADRQKEAGKVDAGIRGAVTGGQHMGALETLVVDILIAAGLTEPYFPVDPVFKGASYAERYATLCRRLVLERLYTAVCLTLATRPTAEQSQAEVSHPSPDVSFGRFVAALEGHVHTFLKSG